MASCVKCGKPIGLLEYTLGDSKQLGLCKKCRKNENWCNDCTNFLTIKTGNTAVIRCLKYGYDLSNKKDWKAANNCPDFTNKTAETNKKKTRPKKQNQSSPTLSRNWATAK